MATFNWTALNNNAVIAFNPAVDVFDFNDAAISAADIDFGGNTDVTPALTFVSFGGKSVTLQVNPLALTTTNVTFADGSMLIIGDNATGIVNDHAANTLVGGAGDDQLIGLGGADSLVGGAGNDVFAVFGDNAGVWGNDTIDGGSGIDRVIFPGDEGAGVNVNLATAPGSAIGGEFGSDTLTLISIEQVYGSMFADTLAGGSGNELFSGQAGSDVITGGAGSDTLDYLNSPARVIVNMLGMGSITVGADTVAASTARDGWGPAATNTDTISQMENVLGSAFNDFIIGNGAINRLEGGAGNDTLTGGGSNIMTGDSANDTLLGGAGDDELRQTRGADHLDGGDGFNDRLVFTNPSGASTTGITYGGAVGVNVNLAAGTSDGDTSGVNPLATVSGIEQVFGTAGNDVLTGGSLARSSSGTFLEAFRGGTGNDTLDGQGAGQGGALGFLDRAEYNDPGTVTSVIANLGLNPIIVGSVTVAGGTARDGTSTVTGGGTDTLLNIDWVVGGNFNDTLVGGNPANDNFERFEGRGGNDLIDGGSGIDQASYQSATNPVNANLGLGMASSDGFGGTDTLLSIEQLRGGSAGDVLTGSDSAGVVELFVGGGGNDTIDGGGGLDFASWQTTALTDGGVNAFIENGSGTVSHAATGTDTLSNIEGLAGSHSGDTLAGGLGDQWFRGRGGSDILNGGAGIDTADYSIDPNGVSVNLSTSTATDGWGGIFGFQGTDTLTSIENVVGSGFNDNITGSSGANLLDGGAGNDTLNGGLGNDTMIGGTGNDTHIVNSALDVVTEALNAGTDTIQSSVSRTLPGNVEKLTLTGVGNINGTGNGLANTITGNSGANVLNGGAGNDTMIGGAGNDTYVVNAAGDVVTEALNAGTDTIQSSVTRTLPGNVERLTLTGAGAINGTGNTLNNTLTGNTGANVLNGGAGNDTLIGGNGNDTLAWDPLDGSLQGGAGSDTLRVDGAGKVVNLTTVPDTRITNVEVVNLTGSGANTLTVGLADVLAISSSTDTLRVDGNAGDTVHRGTGWTTGADQMIGANTYHSYTQGLATLLVDTDITSVV